MSPAGDLPVNGLGAEGVLRENALLQERARVLARPIVVDADDGGTLEVLEFALAQERYAVETRHVREVLALRQLTPLPCTPSFVLGIVNVRGHMLPVLDLREFLGLPQGGLTDLHRVVVVGDDARSFGILADMGVGVRRLPLSSLQAGPVLSGGPGANYVRAVTSEHLVVLDVTRILEDPRLVVDEGRSEEAR